jgi:hypothetical protein
MSNEGVTSYVVSRDDNPDFATPTVTTVTDTWHLDAGPLTIGQSYYYRVQAQDDQSPTNISAVSITVIGTARDVNTAPSGRLVANGRDGAVHLKAQFESTPPANLSKYQVYRKPNARESCMHYTWVGELNEDNEYTDGAVTNNAAYDYALVALMDDGTNVWESTFSTPGLGIPLDRPFNLFQCQGKNCPPPRNLRRSKQINR